MDTRTKEATSSRMRSKGSSATRMQDEVVVNSSARPESATGLVSGMDMTIDDVKALLDAKLQSAYQEFISTPQEEMAEPLFWWDLYAWGPWQPGAKLTPPSGFSGPLLPNQVIRLGETAYVATIIVLNTNFPTTGPSAAEILSNFALPYQVEYGTGELKKWQPAPAYLQHIGNGNLIPNVPYAVDVFGFKAQDEGLYEMNITVRIYGCGENAAPPFAGFATRVVDIDQDMFGGKLHVEEDIPIRFQCYR